jgi:acetoin utilization deacetylase AcuC-like enzyme
VGNIINLPLPTGTDGKTFRAKYTETILPAVRKFNPQLLLISAGFDAHKGDPLASLRLVEEDYAWVTRQLREIADASCDGRILSALEGGYDLRALSASVAAHVAGLAGLDGGD